METAKRDQLQRACLWLESAGVAVPRKPGGEPDVTVTIASSFALDAEDVKARADQLPQLKPGDVIHID